MFDVLIFRYEGRDLNGVCWGEVWYFGGGVSGTW